MQTKLLSYIFLQLNPLPFQPLLIIIKYDYIIHITNKSIHMRLLQQIMISNRKIMIRKILT